MLIIGLSACKKDNEQPKPQEQVGKLKKITLSDDTFSTFEYNAKGLLQKCINKIDDGILETILYEYDAKDRISKIKYQGEGGKEYRLTYHVDAFGNEVLQKTGQYVGNILVNEFEFFFNPQKQLTQQRTYIVLGENSWKELLEKITFEYNEVGNLVIEKHFTTNLGTTDFELLQTIFYEEYDNKPIAYNFVELHPFLPTNLLMKNNPLQISAVAEGNLYSFTQKYQYTYFADGKVKAAKITTEGGINFELQGTLEYY